MTPEMMSGMAGMGGAGGAMSLQSMFPFMLLGGAVDAARRKGQQGGMMDILMPIFALSMLNGGGPRPGATPGAGAAAPTPPSYGNYGVMAPSQPQYGPLPGAGTAPPGPQAFGYRW